MSKKWKDFLLSSGLPLEHDVKQILEKHNIIRPIEYRYERHNENGVPVVFSTDIYGTHITDQNIFLELLIECKYRHNSVQWIFTPSKYYPIIDKFSDVFITLDELSDEKRINESKINSAADRYDLCSKGVEILNDKFNPKSIKQCVQQLKFAVVNVTADALRDQVDRAYGESNPIFVIVPIIVTTAQLWRIKPELSMEDILEAKELEEVAVKKDILILQDEPDNELIRYTQKKFEEHFTQEQKIELDAQMKNGFEFYVRTFSQNHPSMFVVINYDRFESSIKNLISFFGQDSLLK